MRVREHRSTRHSRVRFHPIVLAKVQMADHRRVPRSVREPAFDELPEPAVREMVPDEQDLAVEGVIVVGLQVPPCRARGTSTRRAICFRHRHRSIRGVEEASGAVEHHPARVDDVDAGVHEDGDVRRARESGHRGDLRGAERLSQSSHRGHELARRPLELRAVRKEHGIGTSGHDEVGFPDDDR